MLILLPSWGRVARGGRASAVGAACGWEEVVEPSSLRYLQAKISCDRVIGFGPTLSHVHVLQVRNTYDGRAGYLHATDGRSTADCRWFGVLCGGHGSGRTTLLIPFLLSPVPQVLQLHLFVLRDCTCRLACN